MNRWRRVAPLLLTALFAACDEDPAGPGPSEPGAAVLTGDITADRTLRKDTVYTLRGFVHVTNGATLTIEAGTRIEGDFDVVGSSLFIMRGASIRALGTAQEPIVFTSSRPEGQRQPGDWGGLIIIGNARINRSSPTNIEGTGTGLTNPEIDYAGGTDDDDSSGELHYVRVEFAGYAPSEGNELNAFTFAAVGAGTQVDHLQAMAGLDDHFEWFGGRVDAKYLVSYESGDDHFDMSEGYSGRLQHLIAYQSKVLTPRTGAGTVSSDPQGIENDGCSGANCLDGQFSQPYTLPVVANFTLVGPGPGVVDATQGGHGMVLRRGTGGFYVNGILARWPKHAISLRDAASTGARIDAGDFVLTNVLVAETPAVLQPGTGIDFDEVTNDLVSVGQSAASLFASLPAAPTAGTAFDWTPADGSAAATGGMSTFAGPLAARAGGVVTATTYRGAAAPGGPKWWDGWTVYLSN